MDEKKPSIRLSVFAGVIGEFGLESLKAGSSPRLASYSRKSFFASDR